MRSDANETELARKISKLSQAQLEKLLRLLGDPPNLANVPTEFWNDYAAGMQSVLLPSLEKMYLESAAAMLEASPAIGVDWELVNQNAATWARNYSFE